MKDKKGLLALENIFIFLVIGFIFVLIVGVFIYTFGIIDTTFSEVTIPAGSVNISEANAKTFGQVNTGLASGGDLIGLMVLFGMILAMFLSAYLTRNEGFILFFIIDIIILVFAYILATELSNAYEIVINQIPFSSVYTSNLANSSFFLLHLPIITLIVGAITMIITYAGIPKTKQEEVAGF